MGFSWMFFVFQFTLFPSASFHYTQDEWIGGMGEEETVLRANETCYEDENLLDDVGGAWYDAKKFESEMLCRCWPPFFAASQSPAVPRATSGIAST